MQKSQLSLAFFYNFFAIFQYWAFVKTQLGGGLEEGIAENVM